jgi:hypothetical protein
MAARTEMPNRKHISGLHAARAADEFARREPVKWVSSPQEEGKQVVALTAAPAIGAKKGPPRLRKSPGRNDTIVAPTIGLEEYKAALRQVFGETRLDEFVDVMLTQLVSVLRPGPLDVLDEATLNTAIALIASVQPRSELEALIAVQIAATAFAGLEFLHLSQRHLEGAYIEVWGGHAIRLLRLELKLIQRLDDHRGSNKQKVRVEHVHIHAGAQGVSGISNSSKERDNGVEEDAKKGPPRLRKPCSRNDTIVAPTRGLEEYKAALRQVFGETLADEFVDVMVKKLVSVLCPGPFDVLDEATLNTAIALIASVQPRTELEAVIALQIAATAFAGLKFLHLSQRHRDGVCVEVWGGFATRLLRLELELTETLDKHRRGHEQTVRVEHVHIHAGDQGMLKIVNSSKETDGGVEEEK